MNDLRTKDPRRRGGLALAAGLVVALSLSAGHVARAQETRAAPTSATSERAMQLYNAGKKLATEGTYAEACLMFEESQKLEPAIGTQFQLADCYAHTKRPATALALFRDVLRVAQLSGKHERQRAAEERITALEASVPRLRVLLSAELAARLSRQSELLVRRDGAPVANEELAKAIPVDPGEHVVTVSAAGYEPWESRVAVAEGVATTDVTVPALVEIARPASKPRTSTLSYAGAGMGGVGLVALVAGGVLGLVALSQKGDAGCDGADCRAPGANAQTLRDAQTSATLSTVFLVSGAALVGGGATLWFLGRKKAPVTANASIAPGGGMLVLGRSF